MGMVVSIFADVGSSVSGSRSLVTTTDQLRNAQRRLSLDLGGVTCPTIPSRSPDDNEGYLEIVEGPIGPIVAASSSAFNVTNRDGLGTRDTTFGDADDLLMLTVRSRPNEPFVGRFSFKDEPNTAAVPPEVPDGTDALGDFVWRSTTITSEVAEVCWFVRGRTLYRRTLLVLTDQQLPDTDVREDPSGSGLFPHTPLPVEPAFYRYYDISVHQTGGGLDRSPVPTPVKVVPNTLGDLTRRERRYGHQPYVYPHEVRFWGGLGLPTLRECSYIGPDNPPSYPPDDYWPFPLLDLPAPHTPYPEGTALIQSNVYGDAGSQLICPSHASASAASADPVPLVNVYGDWQQSLVPPAGQMFDPWVNPYPALQLDPVNGTLVETRLPPTPDDRRYLGNRVGEDIILNNVLAFDVKVYDSGAPIIVETDTGSGTIIKPGDAGYLAAINGLAAGTHDYALSFGGYVDLGYMATLPALANGLPDYVSDPSYPLPQFHHSGNPFSRLQGSAQGGGAHIAATWDSYSDHYEHDGFNQDGDDYTDEGRDGFDNPIAAGSMTNNDSASTIKVGGIDDPLEREAPPPYDAPLRGLQIRIRVFEPNSRQIREVTVVQDFLPG